METLGMNDVLAKLDGKRYIAVTATDKSLAANVLRAILKNSACLDDAVLPQDQTIDSNLLLIADPAIRGDSDDGLKNLTDALEDAHLVYDPTKFTVAKVPCLSRDQASSRDTQHALEAILYIPYPKEGSEKEALRSITINASLLVFPIDTANYEPRELEAKMTFLSTCNPSIAVPLLAKDSKLASVEKLSEHIKSTYGAMTVTDLSLVGKMVQIAPEVNAHSFLGIRNSLFRILREQPRMPAGIYEAGCMAKKQKKRDLLSAGATAATATAATALITSGVLLQIIPGLGTIAGGGLIATGLGALGLGGLAASSALGSAAFMGVIAACGCTIASKYAVESIADRAYDSYQEKFETIERSPDKASSPSSSASKKSGSKAPSEKDDVDEEGVPIGLISEEMEVSIREYLAALQKEKLPDEKACGKDYTQSLLRTDLVFLYFDANMNKECPIDIQKKPQQEQVDHDQAVGQEAASDKAAGQETSGEAASDSENDAGLLDASKLKLNSSGNLYCVSGKFKKDELISLTSVLRLVVKANDDLAPELASLTDKNANAQEK